MALASFSSVFLELNALRDNQDPTELIEHIKMISNVDFRDPHTGLTLLHVAAWKHNIPIISLLLEKGADPNVKSNRGEVPILRALGRNHKNNPEILQLFLNYGLSLDNTNQDGTTIRDIILSFEDRELTRIIQDSQ